MGGIKALPRLAAEQSRLGLSVGAYCKSPEGVKVRYQDGHHYRQSHFVALRPFQLDICPYELSSSSSINGFMAFAGSCFSPASSVLTQKAPRYSTGVAFIHKVFYTSLVS